MGKKNWIICGAFFVATLILFAIWSDPILKVDDSQTRAAQVDYSLPLVELLGKSGYDYSVSTTWFRQVDDCKDTATTMIPVTFYCFTDADLSVDTILTFLESKNMQPATIREVCFALSKGALENENYCAIALGTKVMDDGTCRYARLTYYLGKMGAHMALNNPTLPYARNYYAATPRRLTRSS